MENERGQRSREDPRLHIIAFLTTVAVHVPVETIDELPRVAGGHVVDTKFASEAKEGKSVASSFAGYT